MVVDWDPVNRVYFVDEATIRVNRRSEIRWKMASGNHGASFKAINIDGTEVVLEKVREKSVKAKATDHSTLPDGVGYYLMVVKDDKWYVVHTPMIRESSTGGEIKIYNIPDPPPKVIVP